MSERAVPILPSRDLAETLAFYERLGFENRGAPPEEWNYLIIGRGDIWLHFLGMPEIDPLTTIASCYLFVDDADALHEAWRDVIEADPTTGSRVEEPMTTDYGLREFAVVDRSGNLIRVGSFLPG
jgi:catechol 2,3-dioxygenase-like lactoylglutathione lyase family enzyme